MNILLLIHTSTADPMFSTEEKVGSICQTRKEDIAGWVL